MSDAAGHLGRACARRDGRAIRTVVRVLAPRSRPVPAASGGVSVVHNAPAARAMRPTLPGAP
ncbi:hypothetical protein [Actinomycetospora straminea]|uniref:Uncharacterized protein n=1 Tax=Actinomycetospora straminea TaxID=663607 RepID=A0ABP9E4Q7_9PSEU|nr:hypothetical protein [Actinomycetospora straminea]MDD7931450.1 hypothetical protein [Actinomycetospora straminea]